MSWTDSSPISFMVLQFPKTTRCTVPNFSTCSQNQILESSLRILGNHRLRPRSPPQVRCKSLPRFWVLASLFLDNRSCRGSFREENRLLFEIVVQACLAHRGARLVIGRNLKNDLLQISKYYIIGQRHRLPIDKNAC